jgi:arylsulfatase A-like enzyme
VNSAHGSSRHDIDAGFWYSGVLQNYRQAVSMRKSGFNFFIAAALLTGLVGCVSTPPSTSAKTSASVTSHSRRVIVFVWDGMRPDAITEIDTPHLAALAKRGSYFADNHSTYPTITMINGATFASGAFPGSNGFYGNRIYVPGVAGVDAVGKPVDLTGPVFTEDHAILEQLDANQDRRLLQIGTLFQAAQQAGLITAAVGKSGPAFLQDYKKGGVILDEKSAFPLTFAQELQAVHMALPQATPFGYPPGTLELADDNGDPTVSEPIVRMANGVTSDPSVIGSAPHVVANRYLMSVFLDVILPRHHPDLSVVWLRNPDSTEHAYGVGSNRFHAAVRAQDELLGMLEGRLAALGLDKTTDLIVVSDHGHSNVSGPLDIFPLRKIENGKVTDVDDAHGYPVSGDVRIAEELTEAGIPAFDGAGCLFDPVGSGVKADGSRLHADRIDTDGKICGKPGAYTSVAYRVPVPLVPRNAFVIATNGGSSYLYQPAHDPAIVRDAVRYLQSHEQFGAIFVDARYGSIPGTLPLAIVRLENSEGRNPDIVVGYSFDAKAIVNGMPGIEFSSVSIGSNRGDHGSFSPIDVHNTLIASGPDFRANFTDTLPSGNVDVAPTVAAILGVSLPRADGRPLFEALRGCSHPDISAYTLNSRTLAPQEAATGLDVRSATGEASGKTRYSFELQTKQLSLGDQSWTYFDTAKAERH